MIGGVRRVENVDQQLTNGIAVHVLEKNGHEGGARGQLLQKANALGLQHGKKDLRKIHDDERFKLSGVRALQHGEQLRERGIIGNEGGTEQFVLRREQLAGDVGLLELHLAHVLGVLRGRRALWGAWRRVGDAGRILLRGEDGRDVETLFEQLADDVGLRKIVDETLIVCAKLPHNVLQRINTLSKVNTHGSRSKRSQKASRQKKRDMKHTFVTKQAVERRNGRRRGGIGVIDGARRIDSLQGTEQVAERRHGRIRRQMRHERSVNCHKRPSGRRERRQQRNNREQPQNDRARGGGRGGGGAAAAAARGERRGTTGVTRAARDDDGGTGRQALSAGRARTIWARWQAGSHARGARAGRPGGGAWWERESAAGAERGSGSGIWGEEEVGGGRGGEGGGGGREEGGKWDARAWGAASGRKERRRADGRRARRAAQKPLRWYVGYRRHCARPRG
ncbi:hypothetical protein FGB62_91g026 [Gracilaria domingensis]|nr:hypothetical protein FGB62_91g026 [Gracilaria domingensis]